jgi:UDP-N-acetylmuramate--alanine ligase
MNIDAVKRVHMIGVGGIGMSALARLLVHDGKTVSGSDRAESPITDKLTELGITFSERQVKVNITNDIELVIYTEAMSEDNEEMQAARKLGVPMMNYFKALGLVANQYYLIAVSGTHGKTTTTAMLTDVLEEASFDPTVVVGSLRSKTGSNFRAGKSKYAIVEACEYRRNFLSLTPDVLVITNIEAEHLDYFKSLEDIEQAFGELVGQVHEEGVVVCNPANQSVKRAVENAVAGVVDYTKFIDPLLQLKVPGTHNFQNAGAALAVAAYLGIDKKEAHTALEHFAGTWRRFEYKGVMETGALVYDDYAHHPTEIAAAIDAARELYPDKQITVVFQPHLYSRLAELFEGFVTSLSTADRLIVTDVYDARHTYKTDVDSEKLVQALKGHRSTEYIAALEDIADYLKRHADTNDVILILGAGDIVNLSPKLVKGTG